MDKTKKSKAEKLQIKLDKLLQSKQKKQVTFEKYKQELNAISKEVDSVKLKLFEILQSGSDDVKFSDWAKRKISENGNSANSENGNIAKNENASFAKSENPVLQNRQQHTEANRQHLTD